jgi:iron complex outermembrane receptor protein
MTGVVTDSVTAESVIGARLEIRELKRGAVSRKDGSFEIRSIPHGSYRLYITSSGYVTKILAIEVHSDTTLQITLAPLKYRSQDVIIHAVKEKGEIHSTVVMSGASLDEHRGGTLGEALKDISGVTLLSTGVAIAKPVIRGMHSERIAVINAGTMQEGQQWGAEHAPEIDPFAASRIEVIKGASGVEYGSGALAGVINVVPREIRSTGAIGGIGYINAFSNNRQMSGSLLCELPADHILNGLGMRFQLSSRYAGNSSTPDYILGNTGYRDLNGSAAVGYDAHQLRTELYYAHYASTLGILSASHFGNKDDLLRAIERGRPAAESSFTYTIDPPMQKVLHDLATITAKYPIDDIGRLEFIGGIQRNDRKEFDAHINRFTQPEPGTALSPATWLVLSTYSAELKLHHDPIGAVYGTVGSAFQAQQNYVGGKTGLIPPYLSNEAGLYMIEHYLLGRWTIDAGLRYDMHTRSVTPLDGGVIEKKTYASITSALGTSLLLGDWTIRSTLASGWRPPSVSELYANGVHHGTSQYEIGDRALMPERNYAADLTLEYRSDDLRFSAAGYYTYFPGFISTLPDTMVMLTLRGAFPVFRYIQSASRIYGSDLSLSWQLFRPLRLETSASILFGDNIARREPLFQMPAPRGTIRLHYDLDVLYDSYLEAQTTLVSRQTRYPLHSDLADPPKGYALYDLTARSKLSDDDNAVVITVTIQNILNTSYRDYLSRYRYFADDPGRSVNLRITIPFGEFHQEH